MRQMRKLLFLLISLLNFFVVNANENNIKEIKIYKVPYYSLSTGMSTFTNYTEKYVVNSSESEIIIIHGEENINEFQECLDERVPSESNGCGSASIRVVIEWYDKHDVKLGSCCIDRCKRLQYNHKTYKCEKLVKYIANHVSGFMYDEKLDYLRWNNPDPSDDLMVEEINAFNACNEYKDAIVHFIENSSKWPLRCGLDSISMSKHILIFEPNEVIDDMNNVDTLGYKIICNRSIQSHIASWRKHKIIIVYRISPMRYMPNYSDAPFVIPIYMYYLKKNENNEISFNDGTIYNVCYSYNYEKSSLKYEYTIFFDYVVDMPASWKL